MKRVRPSPARAAKATKRAANRIARLMAKLLSRGKPRRLPGAIGYARRVRGCGKALQRASMNHEHRLLADVDQPVRGAAEEHAPDQRAAPASHHHEIDVCGLRRLCQHLRGRTRE